MSSVNAVTPAVGARPKIKRNSATSRTSLGGSLYASTILSMETDESDYEDDELNDQQWVLQRKKIGLSRKTKRSITKATLSQNRKKNILSFIKENLKRKECMTYVKNPRGAVRFQDDYSNQDAGKICYCGVPERKHKSRIQHKLASRKPPMNETIEEEDETSISSSVPILGARGSGGASSLELRFESRGTNDIPLKVPHRTEKTWVLSPDPSTTLRSSLDEGLKDILDSPPPPKSKMENQNSAQKKNDENRKDNSELPPWSPETSCQEFVTDAYGQIEFTNEDEGSLKPSKYIRLSSDTPMHTVKELLVDYWGLFSPKRPNLALSLIGGAKNFKMEGRKQGVFKNGLIGAAKSTNAFILTGGTNTGTMKLVGDAVREGQFLIKDGQNHMSRGIKLFGLVPYGFVLDFETFINPDPNQFHYVRYNSNVPVKFGQNVPLNGDHTHFLLIDDGYRYSFRGGGGSTKFITKVEDMIRKPEDQGGFGIPIVTLVLEGGKDTIRIVRERLAQGIACVVIEGSGRAADILAYAYKNAVRNATTGKYSLKEGHIAHLKRMSYEAFGAVLKNPTYREQELEKIFNWTMECIVYSDIITIFDIRRETNLDKKILTALLKGDDMTIIQQLYLAMVWNRVDIAEEKILTQTSLDQERDREGLSMILTQALLRERIDFIELLVMNGFLMRTYLTVERLRNLYNESNIKWKELRLQLKHFVGFTGKEIRLRTIHKYLVQVLKEHSMPQYQLDRSHKKSDKTEASNDSEGFDDPYMELFLWSVLCYKKDLIDMFWRRCSQPMVAAIVAASFYSRLVKFYNSNAKRKNLAVQALKQTFQGRANKLAEVAFQSDQSKGISLLEQRHKRWGDHNIMEIAYIGHVRSFISNPESQILLNISWKRGFTYLPWYSCLICIFMPFLVWTPLVKFQGGLGDDGGDLSPFQKLYVFYKAPIVKYTGTCISFFFLLLLYSYVALFAYRWEMDWAEFILQMWILILVLDEFREVVLEPSRTLPGKSRDHMDSVWNRLDISMFFFAFLSAILRHFHETYQISKIIFATNTTLFFVRTFRIYHANWKLGPKLVIFHKMIPEIITFMFLLLIFIVGYGVASQALLNPYREFKDLPELVFNIFFLPYWQMYGELSLDNLRTVNSTTCHIFGGSYCENTILYDYIVQGYLAVFLLIGNVMLLNLLIAIFTSVFEEVHENSTEVWKWEMYRLVEEYDKKPGLAPPFVIFEDMWKLGKGIWKRTCRRKKENLDSYILDTLEVLRLFEKDCMISYSSMVEKQEQSALEHRIQKIEERTEYMLEMLENAPDDDGNWGAIIETDTYLKKSDDSTDSDEDTPTTRFKHVKAVLNGPPKSSRIRTARSAKSTRKLNGDISDLKERIIQMEQDRREEIEDMKQRNEETQQRIENMLKRYLQQKD